jgi:hypothetical protein
MKTHKRDIRLFANAGMAFPACHSNAKLLDTDKSVWKTTGDNDKVTCKKCLYIVNKKD